MRVVLTSDLHGALPEIPECDLLLIGGDVCPVDNHDLDYQWSWMAGTFSKWLSEQPAKNIVGIGGNHDFILETDEGKRGAKELPWTYLQDESTEVNGLNIYGTPWVPNLRSWAFFGGIDGCWGRFERIPRDTDILLSHGPMYGYADNVGPRFGGPMPVGCHCMRDQMPFIKPKMFVCGHIHEGFGHYQHADIPLGIYNVAHMTERYEPLNAPVTVDL